MLDGARAPCRSGNSVAPENMVLSSLPETFARDGYAAGIRIHDAAGAARVRSQFDELEAREGRERCAIGLVDRHFNEPFVRELATHPAVLDAVETVLGKDILLLATHFFCKYPAPELPPDSGRSSTLTPYVAWHQDVTYWGLEPPIAVTAWYAVDDSDVDNGCMRAIPGTHSAIREHGKAEREGNLLSINQEVPVSPDEEVRAADIPLRAGEISLHHGMLIHGSNPNLSTRRRCGLTIRYVPPHVRQTVLNSQGYRWQAILVRGEDRFGNFSETPRQLIPRG